MTESEIITDQLLDKYPNPSRDTLIPLLQDFQDAFGFISKSTVKLLSGRFGLPTSKIYGLVTFYNQFRLHPKGKFHIQVCNGSSCHITSSEKIIKEIEKELLIRDGETTRDQKFSLEILPCIGACGQSPVMSVNDEFYTKLTLSKLKEVLTYYKEKDL